MAMALVASRMWAGCCANSVAVVESLSGSATARLSASAKKIACASLDWLADGATIEVGPRSRAVLILLNGHRYELGEGATATVSANGAPKITGKARELSALPPIPEPAPVEAESASTSGATRIRGAVAMNHLYPGAGMAALAREVTLRFDPLPDATSYRVTLEDRQAKRLLNVTTESTEVPVPNGTMDAGAQYRWRIRAMRGNVEIGEGTAVFTTLSAENAERRAEFARALRAGRANPAGLALLGDVDLRLGLVAEACDEFGAALNGKPQDAAVRRALDACLATLKSK